MNTRSVLEFLRAFLGLMGTVEQTIKNVETVHRFIRKKMEMCKANVEKFIQQNFSLGERCKKCLGIVFGLEIQGNVREQIGSSLGEPTWERLEAANWVLCVVPGRYRRLAVGAERAEGGLWGVDMTNGGGGGGAGTLFLESIPGRFCRDGGNAGFAMLCHGNWPG